MSPIRDKVAIVGIGGLGTAAALELVGRGVRRLGLVDGDRVEISNLHRQLLHGADDVGRPKVSVAAEKLATIDPELDIDARAERLTPHNAAALLADYDFVIDGTDDPPTKFLLNDFCAAAAKPWVYAGVVGTSGQLMTILPHETTCLRCLFPESPEEGEAPSCQQAGILGPLAGLVGALEGREAVKFLRGEGELLTDRLLTIDAATLRTREVALGRASECPSCGTLRPSPSTSLRTGCDGQKTNGSGKLTNVVGGH